MLVSGCRTGAIAARALPLQYRAAAAPGDINLNLARLATSGTSDSIITPGDKLDLMIATGYQDERKRLLSLRVAEDGTIDVPLVGIVQISGQETLQAGQMIERAAVERGIYRQPHVTLDIKEKAVNYITVMGAVTKPGVYGVPRTSSDVLHAIAMAGGMAKTAGTEVEIVKQNTRKSNARFATAESDSLEPTMLAGQEVDQDMGVVQTAYNSLAETNQNLPNGSRPIAAAPGTYRIDLAAANSIHQPGEQFHLDDRDVVMVFPAEDRSVSVSGLVVRPGKITLPRTEDVHLLDAIAMAGGSKSVVADKVYVIRRVEGREQPLVIRASMSRAKQNGKENLRLAPGDTITVEQTPATAVVEAFTKIIRLSVGVSGSTRIF